MVSKNDALDPTLIVDGKRFYSNEYSKEDVDTAIESLREINKAMTFFINEFSVVFHECLPDGTIEKWEKGKGFSIWYAPVHKKVE